MLQIILVFCIFLKRIKLNFSSFKGVKIKEIFCMFVNLSIYKRISICCYFLNIVMHTNKHKYYYEMILFNLADCFSYQITIMKFVICTINCQPNIIIFILYHVLNIHLQLEMFFSVYSFAYVVMQSGFFKYIFYYHDFKVIKH